MKHGNGIAQRCCPGCLLHFIRGATRATIYLKKPHAYEQNKGQYDQQREQNQKSSPTKRKKMRVPNPNAMGHATKQELRVPNPNSRGHVTKCGL